MASLGVTTGSALTVFELKAPPAPTPGPPSPPPSVPAPAPAPTPASASSGGGGSGSGSGSSPAPPAPPQLRQQQRQLDPAMVQSLVEMGFPQEIAERALEAAGGDVHTALEMCMSGDLSEFVTRAGSAGVWVWVCFSVVVFCFSCACTHCSSPGCILCGSNTPGT